MKIAFVTDLHDSRYDDVIDQLKQAQIILIGGDLIHGNINTEQRGLDFLTDAVKIAPTYYALGNHEHEYGEENLLPFLARVKKTGAALLENEYIQRDGFVIGGVSSSPSASMLRQMAGCDGYKLLLCHQPEFFERYVQAHDIDLTLSGHAHGGQICLFGRGLYAPDQGILPRLTGGSYFDGRLIVSRGMANTVWIPRIGNPCELVMIDIKGANS